MTQPYPGGYYLAEPDWLFANLDCDTLCILDARFDVRLNSEGRLEEVHGLDGYQKAHIPGAQFVDLYNDLTDPDQPTSIINKDAFEALMTKLGVCNDTTIVIYDERGGVWAARLWWALRYYGHKNVKMLNGGLTAWRAAGYALAGTGSEAAPEDFQTRKDLSTKPKKVAQTPPYIASINPDLRVEKQDVLAAISDGKTRILDALPVPFYQGQMGLYPRHRKGHIPSAHNIPAEANLDPKSLRILPFSELKTLWESAEIAPEQPVITYCGGGIFASFSLFILALMGHEKTALYDASWMEWGLDTSLPVEIT